MLTPNISQSMEHVTRQSKIYTNKIEQELHLTRAVLANQKLHPFA